VQAEAEEGVSDRSFLAGSALTEKGWQEYRKLVSLGFVPIRQKVIWTLRSDPHVPLELVGKLAALMLGNEP
jgi:hypothetical protein